MRAFDRWKQRGRELKREAHAVYLACKDPRVPWHVRLLGLAVVGYLFSPIDLIPDFIPVLGQLDDLVIVPLGLVCIVKLIPPKVLAEHRDAAKALEGRAPSWAGAAAIIVIWLGLAVWLVSHFVDHNSSLPPASSARSWHALSQ
jgi:uncharacterized membrane protein YkvA (DUF1232 family)